MKVLFLTNVPAPYRVDFFNELGKLCDLTVIFEKKTSTERDDSWSNYKFNTFKGIFLKGISLDTDSAFCPQIIKYVKKETYDYIIVSNFLMPTGMIAIEYMRLRKIKYCLEIDGGFAKSGDGIIERIKRHFIKGANKYFSTAKETDNYYVHYGALPEKIVRYPFTSLKNEDLLPILPQSEEKKQLREKLGIKEKNVIISVGRFSYKGGYGKGFDILMNIADKLPDGTGIYIIGDSATNEFLKIKEERHLSNVHFVEYVKKDRLSLYYRAANLFVLLSRGDVWGLVINEAMAHGLPVISSDKTIAGLELVTNGENGYVVSLDDEDNIVNKMTEIINDPKKQEAMARKSRLKIANHTIENMSETHYKILGGESIINGSNCILKRN